MISPRVRIVPYDPTWPMRYEAEGGAIRSALGDHLVAIGHVGSTSVPGLVAKPTVDILVGVEDLGRFDDGPGEEALIALGYTPRGELGVPGRRYFRKGETFPREFNVHVVEHGCRLWSEGLAFRDHLRAHRSDAEAYAALKSRLLERPGGDRLDAYAVGKADFIARILTEARTSGPD